MPELKKIDGINVLFLDTDKELRKALLEYDKEQITLVVVGHGMEGLNKLLAGRSLTEYIAKEKPKEDPRPLSEIIKDSEAIPFKAMPILETPFIADIPKPHLQKKWYEEKRGKRKRK